MKAYEDSHDIAQKYKTAETKLVLQSGTSLIESKTDARRIKLKTYIA